MKKEFCTRCNTTRDVNMTSSTIVDTDYTGERLVIRTRLFHCKICKSFVRREDCDKGELLKGEDNFSPRARSIWRSIPAEAQLKILSTVWCTRCKNMSGITTIAANVCSGMLVLRGNCRRCGADAARVVENE
jgi:hypothetical protein